MRFARALLDRNPSPEGRRWVFVPYDQLTDRIGPLSRMDPAEAGIVLVESPAKAARRPYHRQKLLIVLANLRHFALEQAARGVAVRHVVSAGGYREGLEAALGETGPLVVMEPAERELRVDLAPLVAAGSLEVVPHEGWLTTPAQFRAGAGAEPPWRMDAFYRRVRRDSGLLMADGKPAGGKWSFDAENRKAWPGEPAAPEPLRFEVDAVTAEVVDLIESRFSDHPGRLDASAAPTRAEDARALWDWALRECLPRFGPFEDAMSTRSRGLFHTRISALLHLHRLLPADVVRDAAESGAPLASREGFVRQVLGWREFVRHVHRETDGFRALPEGVPSEVGRAGAAPTFLGADRALPDAFWEGSPSGLYCLDTVVREVWEDGYGHHITRLMVLSNLATLLRVSPREITDWFWAAYLDAFDWVVEPNVLGMGTFGAGDLMTTKPYVSGTPYIHRMSDYCASCAFDPKKNCPISALYWTFLEETASKLEGNHRLAMPLRSAAKRSAANRDEHRRIAGIVSARLTAGDRLAPEDFAP